jgi:tRNA 2-thiouridine synthesizing protein A
MRHVYIREPPVFCAGRRLSSTPRNHPKSMAETILDLTGLKCPLPALKTRKALQKLAPGDRLVVTCTDPLAGIDIPNLIRETGDRIEEQIGSSDRLVFRILKGA